MSVSLDDYVKHLQSLQAQGHGHLPVCYCDDLNDWGYEALQPGELPAVVDREYADETCTRWRGKSGPFIAL